MKTNILFVSSGLNGGGAEKISLNILNELQSKEYENLNYKFLFLNTQGDYKLDSKLDYSQLNTFSIIGSIIPMYKFLKKNKPKHVFSNTRPTNIILGILKYFINFNLVGREPNLIDEIESFNFFKKSIYRLLIIFSYSKINKLICNSNDTLQSIASFAKINYSKLLVIYNPVLQNNYKVQHNIDFNHKWLNNKKIKCLVACGRLTEQKNYPALLRVFKHIIKKNDSCRLLILGKGKLLNRMKNYALELGVNDKLEFLGFKNNVLGIMKKSDIFVLTSKWEGFGNVIVESLSVGTPVVGFNCKGGPKEIINTKALGELVENFDEKKMSEVILQSLNKNYNTDKIINYCDKFTVRRITNQILNEIIK